ncbi:MAG: hypothetical protein ACTHNB_07210 [Gaiellaceae bacterium]
MISRLRHGRAWDEWDQGGDAEAEPAAAANASGKRSGARRVAVSLTFAALFVAGAAFSASAGDQVRSMLENSAVTGAAATDATTTDATTTDAATDPTTTSASTDPADLPDGGGATVPAPTATDGGATAATPADTPPAAAPTASATAQAAVQQAATGSASSAAQAAASTSTSPPEAAPAATASRAAAPAKAAKTPKPAPVDLEGAAASNVWLNRSMPDPTPPAMRLKPFFARHLLGVARANRLDWALLLGVLRAEGHNGAAPSNLAGLRTLAGRLSQDGVKSATPWAATFAVSGETSFADRAVALSHYYRAVGLRALVRGLEAQKAALGKKVLNDPRVTIYTAGRGDIESGRVDVRVLASIEYLADSFGQVTVSCLISGHRLYARPGVISAHIYGLAADISEVGGTAIYGHQQPGGITERAVRDVLLLPPEMMPKQVISLLGLGGPSFALANHYDHIHIGY